MSSGKQRLDKVLVERGLVETRYRAQALIMAGKVMVGDKRADKPGTMVSEDTTIYLKATKEWASRGAFKLLGALEAMPHLSEIVRDADCLDIGASTGGFTDVLLAHGASRVVALDVGYGQLHWKLQQDERVIMMDRTNIRHVTPDMLPFVPQLATCDASFISLTAFLHVVYDLLETEGMFVALVKPQFEVGRERLGKGGIVRDDKDRQWALDKVIARATGAGFSVVLSVDSPIHGPKGNREILLVLEKTSNPMTSNQPSGE